MLRRSAVMPGAASLRACKTRVWHASMCAVMLYVAISHGGYFALAFHARR